MNQALGRAHAAGFQNHVNIAGQQFKSPTKIMTACIQGIIKLLDSISVFSRLGSLGFQDIVDFVSDAAMQYAATAVCQVVQQQFNSLMSQAFNAVAFLNDVVPCGVGINLPGLNTGDMPGLCQIIGGPLVNIGTSGGTVYSMPSSPMPTLNGSGSGNGQIASVGQILGPLLGGNH